MSLILPKHRNFLLVVMITRSCQLLCKQHGGVCLTACIGLTGAVGKSKTLSGDLRERIVTGLTQLRNASSRFHNYRYITTG